MSSSPPPLIERLQRRLSGSLAARVVVGALGLLIVVQAATMGVVEAGLIRQARDLLPERLATGEQVLDSLLDQRAARLATVQRLLAADPGFRDAALSRRNVQLEAALENHAARAGATEAAWLAPDFTLLAAAGTGRLAVRDIAPATAHLAAQAAATGSASSVALIDGRPHQLVLVPMKSPAVIGWVLMGLPLDRTLVDDVQRLSGLALTLLVRPPANGTWSAAWTGLPPALAQRLTRESWSPAGPAVAGMRSVLLEGEEFGVHGRWLTPPDHAGAVLALVSASLDDTSRLPRALHFTLLAITLAAGAALVVAGWLWARRITTPLNALVDASERLGAGDFETPVPGPQRGDEPGRLVQAFEQMRVKIDAARQDALRLAYWDALTGLPNRAQFRNAVAQAIDASGAESGSCAVVMLALDRIDQVGDALGHRFVRLLLQGVAERLSQQIVRGDDVVACLDGHTFAILLRQADPTLAQSVAQRIARAFDTPLQLEQHAVDTTVFIGVACARLHAAEADTLLHRAELAMHAARRHGQGPQLYDPAIDAASTQTLALLGELRHAVEQRELRLYLQPKLALDSANVVGAEALLRWQHPTRGLLPPQQFIPVAEQTGFIRTLTLWVFEEAAAVWRELHKGGIVLPLSINLSARDLLDVDLPAKLEALLVRHRVPAEAFCLELTEGTVMADPQRVLGVLHRLSGLGFALSIDDFGVGCSSLAHLKKLPLDELKIDRSIVAGMETDIDDARVVRSCIELAHNLGLSVVAEGVESAKVWDMLRELNCDQAQGFHMGRPMPAADFARWATTWSERRKPFTPSQAMRLH